MGNNDFNDISVILLKIQVEKSRAAVQEKNDKDDSTTGSGSQTYMDPVFTDSQGRLHQGSLVAGNRDLIFEISQKAIHYGVQGLMIEVHSEPEHALTDKCQQIIPLKLRELIRELSR